jgi:hypothetical protein
MDWVSIEQTRYIILALWKGLRLDSEERTASYIALSEDWVDDEHTMHMADARIILKVCLKNILLHVVFDLSPSIEHRQQALTACPSTEHNSQPGPLRLRLLLRHLS